MQTFESLEKSQSNYRPYKCLNESCDSAFKSVYNLKSHIAREHSKVICMET